jgi:hypothetical protein
MGEKKKRKRSVKGGRDESILIAPGRGGVSLCGLTVQATARAWVCALCTIFSPSESPTGGAAECAYSRRSAGIRRWIGKRRMRLGHSRKGEGPGAGTGRFLARRGRRLGKLNGGAQRSSRIGRSWLLALALAFPSPACIEALGAVSALGNRDDDDATGACALRVSLRADGHIPRGLRLLLLLRLRAKRCCRVQSLSHSPAGRRESSVSPGICALGAACAFPIHAYMHTCLHAG